MLTGSSFTFCCAKIRNSVTKSRILHLFRLFDARKQQKREQKVGTVVSKRKGCHMAAFLFGEGVLLGTSGSSPLRYVLIMRPQPEMYLKSEKNFFEFYETLLYNITLLCQLTVMESPPNANLYSQPPLSSALPISEAIVFSALSYSIS